MKNTIAGSSFRKLLAITAMALCLGPIGSMGQVVTLDSATTTQAQMRTAIQAGTPGSIFLLCGPGWTLTSRLEIPVGVTLIGTRNGGAPVRFLRGFNGTAMVTVQSYVTMQGVCFDGNKSAFSGEGVVAGKYSGGSLNPGAASVQELMWSNVTVKNCTGNGLVLSSVTRRAIMQNCTFDANGGAGVLYAAPASSSHSLNRWESCIFSNNTAACVAFVGAENCAVWENCQFINNAGVVFENKCGTGVTYGIAVRDGVICGNGGPAWLNRSGEGGATFVDCRIKGNGATPPSGLTAPIGLFHIEGGKASLEVRGGAEFLNNPANSFTTTTASLAGSKFTVAGGGNLGTVNAQNASLFITDTSLIPANPTVSQGIGLDPLTGTLIKYP